MEETEKATRGREAPKGPRLPWISTMEPTVFWGIVILLGLVGVVLPLWGIWSEQRLNRQETTRLRQIEELRRSDGPAQQRDGDGLPR